MPLTPIAFRKAANLKADFAVQDDDPLPVTSTPAAYSAANDTSVVSGTTADITDTTATTVIAGAASVKLHITHVIVQNAHATQSTWVQLTEETSGTVLYNIYAAAVGGGASIMLPTPLIVPTANKALQAKCVTTGASVRVSASGYKV